MNSIFVEKSGPLEGTLQLSGAKNAVLVEIASLLLIDGVSTLTHVPFSEDVYWMCSLLEDVGARVYADKQQSTLTVDASALTGFRVSPERMKKMRASILVLGPLLARFCRADVAVPGGCVLGARPIDYHIKNFEKMGVSFMYDADYLRGSCSSLKATKIVLEYPSVGATENILMAATLTPGKTTIINAALEPEVLDLIELLQKAGASICVQAPSMITIEGVSHLKPVRHDVMVDRLEAGTFLIAAAVTGGSISIPQARANDMDVFLMKLEEMGHAISTENGISLRATREPRAVSFKTSPYPAFPTDLQAPMSVAQILAAGKSVIEETVFENRLLYCFELNKMGARINVQGTTAIIEGPCTLQGAHVVGTDIRAAAGLVIAGLVAQGATTITGLHHIKRGYDRFDEKLRALGGKITYLETLPVTPSGIQRQL